jgi:hypothetical protein
MEFDHDFADDADFRSFYPGPLRYPRSDLRAVVSRIVRITRMPHLPRYVGQLAVTSKALLPLLSAREPTRPAKDAFLNACREVNLIAAPFRPSRRCQTVLGRWASAA